MRGRPATPTATKLLNGNPGKRPINKNEPKSEPITKEPPAWLPADARECWDDIFKLLSPLGYVLETDKHALAILAREMMMIRRGTAEIEKYGLTIETDRGPRQNPAVGVVNSATRSMLNILSHFGLTPASRTKIVAAASSEEKDAFEDFLDS